MLETGEERISDLEGKPVKNTLILTHTQKHRKEHKSNMGHSEKGLKYLKLETWNRRRRKKPQPIDTWRNTGLESSKTDKSHQAIDSRSSINSNQNKYKENHT